MINLISEISSCPHFQQPVLRQLVIGNATSLHIAVGRILISLALLLPRSATSFDLYTKSASRLTCWHKRQGVSNGHTHFAIVQDISLLATQNRRPLSLSSVASLPATRLGSRNSWDEELGTMMSFLRWRMLHQLLLEHTGSCHPSRRLILALPGHQSQGAPTTLVKAGSSSGSNITSEFSDMT